jgi:hypothetical protein
VASLTHVAVGPCRNEIFVYVTQLLSLVNHSDAQEIVANFDFESASLGGNIVTCSCFNRGTFVPALFGK